MVKMATENGLPPKFQKHFLNLSFEDGKKMASKKYSCLEEVQHKMTFSLSPKYISNLRLGLKEKMNNFLFLYQAKLGGVPLAYDKIQVTPTKIIDDQELLNVEIQITLIVFKPEVSKILHGCINKIGNT